VSVGLPDIRCLTELAYVDPLHRRDVRADLLIIRTDWRVRWGRLVYTVPAGMVFDGASIPRFFWRLVGPPMREAYRPAAVLHDAAYKSELQAETHTGCPVAPPTRKEADEILRLASIWRGVPSWKATVMYRAVRIGGGRAWTREHKRATHIEASA